MNTMGTIRAVTLVLAALAATAATAGEVAFFVPVNLRGLPAESNLATVSCYLTDRDAPYGIGGETTYAITGGALETTLRFFVRKPDTLAIRSRIAPQYYCRIIVSGERADTDAFDAVDNSLNFQLMAAEDVGAAGWTGTALGWPGYPRPGTATVAVRPAPGSPVNLIVRGAVPPAAITLLETVGTCPCGCGATTGAGSACKGPQTPNLPKVVTPATPAKVPAFDPFNRKGSMPFDKTTLPAAVTTPQIRFTGTGRLELSASR